MKLTTKYFWEAMQWDVLNILDEIIQNEGAVTKSTLECRPEIADLIEKYLGRLSDNSVKVRISEILNGLVRRGRGGPDLIQYVPTKIRTSQKYIKEISPHGLSFINDPEKKNQALKMNERFYYRELSVIKDWIEELECNRFLSEYKLNFEQVGNNIDNLIRQYSFAPSLDFDTISIDFLDDLSFEEIWRLLREEPLQVLVNFCYFLFQKHHRMCVPLLDQCIDYFKDKELVDSRESLTDLYILMFLLDTEKTEYIVNLFERIDNKPLSLYSLAKYLKFLKDHNVEAAKNFFDLIPRSWYEIDVISSKSWAFENRYLSFLEQVVFILDEANTRNLMLPFLEVVAEKSLRSLLASLERINELFPKEKNFINEFKVINYLTKAIANSKLVNDVYEVDEKLKTLTLSSKEHKVLYRAIQSRLETIEPNNVVMFLGNLRWRDWEDESIFRQAITQMSPNTFARILKSEMSPLNFGSALMGLAKISTSFAMETVDILGVNNIIRVIEKAKTFEDFRFWVYGLDKIDPELLNSVKEHLEPNQLLSLIKKEDLSWIAWFHVEYREKLPKITNKFIIQVIHKFMIEQPSVKDVGAMLDILWKNQAFPKEIYNELDDLQYFTLIDEWQTFDFFVDLLLNMDVSLLLQWIDKLPLVQKISYMRLLWRLDPVRYENSLSKLHLPVETAAWEGLITLEGHSDLEWVSNTHPDVYTQIQRLISMKKLQEIFDSNIFYYPNI